MSVFILPPGGGVGGGQLAVPISQVHSGIEDMQVCNLKQGILEKSPVAVMSGSLGCSCKVVGSIFMSMKYILLTHLYIMNRSPRGFLSLLEIHAAK